MCYSNLIRVAQEITDMPGDRRLPFSRAVDYLTDWDEDQLNTANGYLKDIQLIKGKIGHLKKLLEGIVD